MVFFYTRYDYILGSKEITETLKNQTQPQQFRLHIITPAVKFLGLPIGGGMVKMSRLIDAQGQLIHARNYSPEIKRQVKEYKKTLKIPYLKLWKGYLILLSIGVIGSVIYGIKLNAEGKKYHAEKQSLATAARAIKAGQLYGASFFTDAEGNNIQGLPAGWIRISKVEGDTVFVQRSKQVLDRPMFEMEDLEAIKPAFDKDWSERTEKMNYPLLKEAANQENMRGVDLLYIGEAHDKYSGVIMSLKGVE